MPLNQTAEAPWASFQTAIDRSLDHGDERPLKRLAKQLSPDRLRAHAGSLSGEELLAIFKCMNARQRRWAIMLMAGPDRQRLRQAVRDAYVDFMAKMKRRPDSNVLSEYLRTAPTVREPMHIPVNWIYEQGELHSEAAYAYVLDDGDHPRERIALYHLAWSSLAAGHIPLPQPAELALNIRTPLPDAWRFMNLGGWDELPVVDDQGAYCGVLYRDVLVKQLMRRW